MLYFVYCTDKPHKADIRASIREPHLRYMAEYDHHIIAGGPTLQSLEGKADGTALIVNFPAEQSVHDFLDGDPYYQAGLFESRTVKLWQAVRFEPTLISNLPNHPPGENS